MKAGKALKLPFKIVGIIVAVILLLLIGINVWLCVLGLPPKVKDFAVKQMEKQLHRQVQIKQVGLCLLKGIVIRDVKISNRPNFKKGTFLSCDAFVIKYDLLQLLKKKLIIKKLTIEKPEIFIKRYVKNKKVVFNFSDLIPPIPKKQPEPSKEKRLKKKKKAVKGMPKVSKYQIPIDLQIGKMGLEDAKIEIIDTATPKFKEIYKLFDVHFVIENLKLYENKPMDIKTGFGLSVTEFKNNKKTDKDINIEAAIKGVLTLFDKKGLLNPTGTFELALKNGRFTGIQAYEELRVQAKDLTKSVTGYQDKLVKSFNKMSKQITKLQKAGRLGSKVKGASSKADDLASKVAKMDTGFMKGALEWKFLKKTLEFDEVKTKVKIENSKVISEDLNVDFKDFKVLGSGYTALDTSLLYTLSLLAHKKYNKNEFTKAIANKDGEMEFPVIVKGTVSDMKVIFKKAEILKKLQDKIKQAFMDKFKNRAGGLDDIAKQYLNKYMGKYLGDASKYLSKDGAKEAVSQVKDQAKKKLDDAKKKAEAAAKAKLEEGKRKAEAATKAKLEEEKRKAEAAAKAKLEEEERKAKAAAKKKAEEEAKKKLKKFKF